MTTTIVLGSNGESKKEVKGVVFNSVLLDTGEVDLCCDKPSLYQYIELVCLDYGKKNDETFDLMFAYNSPGERSHGTLYLGKWNDGVVTL